jgi:hypothetical protein
LRDHQNRDSLALDDKKGCVGLVIKSGAILPIETDEGTQGCHRAGDGIWGFGQVDVHTGAEGIRLGTWDPKNDMSGVIEARDEFDGADGEVH